MSTQTDTTNNNDGLEKMYDIPKHQREYYERADRYSRELTQALDNINPSNLELGMEEVKYYALGLVETAIFSYLCGLENGAQSPHSESASLIRSVVARQSVDSNEVPFSLNTNTVPPLAAKLKEDLLNMTEIKSHQYVEAFWNIGLQIAKEAVNDDGYRLEENIHQATLGLAAD